MENKEPQKDQPLENIIGGLREEYVSHSPELTKQEAPKVAKQIRIGKPKNNWLILLTVLVILAGVAAAVLFLNLSHGQNTTLNAESTPVIEGSTLEDWADYIDPTMPAETAVSLPEEPTSEPLPVEPTSAPPEVTPWPTPPITPP
jgi:cytoskeletal protein RodZ